TDVELLRGPDRPDDGSPTALLDLMLACLEARPELTIHVLAWDYSSVFALERQWFQGLRFGEQHPRLHFSWDTHLPSGASHHQKIVVVDGCYAFTGGMDVCQARWDTREHRLDDPMRCSPYGRACKAYHDVQTFVSGEVVRHLEGLFAARWLANTGHVLDLPARALRPAPLADELLGPEALPLPEGAIAVAETLIPPHGPLRDGKTEIRDLYGDMVRAAESFIYIENQYFTSRSLTEAFVERLADETRPRLSIVIVMPEGGDTPKEKVALGDAQAFALAAILEASERHGHACRICYTGKVDDTGEVSPTFIHSKLMVVDDRHLTIGSANATNRSFGLDDEVNLAWRAETDDARLRIAAFRGSLLAEHAGDLDPRPWLDGAAMVSRVDEAVADPARCLHRLVIPESKGRDPIVSVFTDPQRPVSGELMEERLDEAWEEIVDDPWWSSRWEVKGGGVADTPSDEARS
ncbi:MAG: phospholipase, partial [Myxococcales bacterium]|nr:phospholipase [Myxococcales bacterium]